VLLDKATFVVVDIYFKCVKLLLPRLSLYILLIPVTCFLLFLGRRLSLCWAVACY
jgi:hypothetical protein